MSVISWPITPSCTKPAVFSLVGTLAKTVPPYGWINLNALQFVDVVENT